MNFTLSRLVALVATALVAVMLTAAAGSAKETATVAAATAGDVTAVDIEYTPTNDGYWILDSTGEVHAYGAAVNHGWGGNLDPGVEYVAVARTPTGGGNWIFTSAGEAIILGGFRQVTGIF